MSQDNVKTDQSISTGSDGPADGETQKTAKDVAGRENKGTMTGILDKLGAGKDLGTKDASHNRLGGGGA
ncbi:hypothetical protein LTR08_001058 [Meristemomyces frigidus]|nr:hypothetical protein LTR08_001058 [Meristemomyces frigidus]